MEKEIIVVVYSSAGGHIQSVFIAQRLKHTHVNAHLCVYIHTYI